MPVQFEFGSKTRGLFERIAKALEGIEDVAKKSRDQSTFSGGMLMFIVKDNQADVPYSITPPTATDAEGVAIPDASLTYEATSTDDSVVSLAPAADGLSGTAHFGAPGQASINVNVSANGTLLGAFGAQFTVTAGDVAAIAGGSIAFDTLSES